MEGEEGTPNRLSFALKDSKLQCALLKGDALILTDGSASQDVFFSHFDLLNAL